MMHHPHSGKVLIFSFLWRLGWPTARKLMIFIENELDHWLYLTFVNVQPRVRHYQKKIDSFSAPFSYFFPVLADVASLTMIELLLLSRYINRMCARASTPIATQSEISRQIERDHCCWFHFRSLLREKDITFEIKSFKDKTDRLEHHCYLFFSFRFVLYGVKQEVMHST